MARAISSEELTLLRSDNQRSLLKLYIDKPSTVITARVSAVPASNDEVTQVTINSVAGTVADVLDGMTVLIGTAAGGYDVGIIRARSATATTLSVGSTSDILWAVDQYITVLDDFQIWARPLRYSDGLWNIEGEVAYTNQHAVMKPVPVLGPTVAVLPLTGATVTFSPTAAGSWVPGSTIASYVWTAPGASSTANMTTAAPTIQYNAPGVYRVRCALTAANGATATGHRIVYVPGTGAAPAENFQIDKLTGDLQSGGWQFSVTLYDPAELAGIRPRALVVLYAEDYYGATKQSIGPISGYENIIALGWIDGATIDWNPEVGLVKFTVKGPAEWMQKTSSWPVSLLDSTNTPADWMTIQNLTIDKALWHMVMWRSTIANMIDVYPNSDTHRSFDCSGNLGSLWEQLKAFAVKIGADPICDRYGRLFMETDSQLVPVASRSSIPVVMDVTKDDWQDTINLQRRDYRQVSLIEVAGFCYATDWSAVIARAPGNAMSQTGSMTSRYNFLFANQSEANSIAALLFAKENNQFPAIPIQLAANNRMIDIAPRQYLSLTVAAADTPLGIAWTAEKIIPRRVEYSLDKDSGMLLAGIECERATVPISPSIEVIVPTVPGVNLPGLPDWDNYDWPTLPGLYGNPEPYIPPEPSIDPDSTCYSDTAAPANGPYDLGVYGPKYTSNDIYQAFRCYVRSSAHDNMTRYEIHGRFQKWNAITQIWEDTLDDDWYQVWAHTSEGSDIVGVKDVVTNPNVRTGTLPGGLTSQLINTMQVMFSGSALEPDSVVAYENYDSSRSVLVSEGSQSWWHKGRGIGFKWVGLTFVPGGAPVVQGFSYGLSINPPSGVDYSDQWYLVHIRATGGDAGHIGFEHYVGPLAHADLAGSDGFSFPIDGNYFGNLKDPFTTQTNSLGLRRTAFPVTWGQTYVFTWDMEVYPFPNYRIVFDNFLLYNICPTLS